LVTPAWGDAELSLLNIRMSETPSHEQDCKIAWFFS